MIEFRAECGHTIRARNDDAGSTVICAYCGHKAQVPVTHEGGLGTLLADTLEESRARVPEPEPRRLNLAPLRVVWTAVFVVLVLSVLIFTMRWVFELWTGERGAGAGPAVVSPERGAKRPFSPPVGTDSKRPRATPSAARRSDVLARLDSSKDGVVVFSVPAGLDVYAQRLPLRDEGRLRSEHYVGRTGRLAGLEVELRPGQYRVCIVASLRNPDLMESPGYAAEVRQVVTRSDDPEEVTEALEDYFIEDGAESWSVDRLKGQQRLVKSFEVEIDRGWRIITALFFPDVGCAESLIFLPQSKSFMFDQRLAEQELRFWNVPDAEMEAALDSLSRIGKAVVTDHTVGTAKVFQVWPDRSVVGEELVVEQFAPAP